MTLSSKYKQNLRENWLNHVGFVKHIIIFATVVKFTTVKETYYEVL